MKFDTLHTSSVSNAQDQNTYEQNDPKTILSKSDLLLIYNTDIRQVFNNNKPYNIYVLDFFSILITLINEKNISLEETKNSNNATIEEIKNSNNATIVSLLRDKVKDINDMIYWKNIVYCANMTNSNNNKNHLNNTITLEYINYINRLEMRKKYLEDVSNQLEKINKLNTNQIISLKKSIIPYINNTMHNIKNTSSSIHLKYTTNRLKKHVTPYINNAARSIKNTSSSIFRLYTKYATQNTCYYNIYMH